MFTPVETETSRKKINRPSYLPQLVLKIHSDYLCDAGMYLREASVITAFDPPQLISGSFPNLKPAEMDGVAASALSRNINIAFSHMAHGSEFPD